MNQKIHQYYVYIITNKANTVFYVGVTSDLRNRVYQHKHKAYPGFSATYNCNKLIYFEQFQWVQDAIAREKQLKGGSRQKKIERSYLVARLDMRRDCFVTRPHSLFCYSQ